MAPAFLRIFRPPPVRRLLKATGAQDATVAVGEAATGAFDALFDEADTFADLVFALTATDSARVDGKVGGLEGRINGSGRASRVLNGFSWARPRGRHGPPALKRGPRRPSFRRRKTL